MNKTLLVSVLTFLFLSSCDAQDKIDPAAFQSAIADGKQQVLDVRTPGEYNAGHIDKALSADWNNKPVFNERVKYLDKSKPIYIYCLSGGRSGAAAKVLREQGYVVKELSGGIVSWKGQGLPLAGKPDKVQMKTEDFDAFISSNSSKLVLVDVGAEWCPPCKKMEPYVNKIAEANKAKLLLFKVDGGNDEEVMKKLNAGSVPYLLLYKDGKEVWRHEGFIEEKDLTAAVNSFLK